MNRAETPPSPHIATRNSGETFTRDIVTRCNRIAARPFGTHGRPLLAIGVLCAIFTVPASAAPPAAAVTEGFLTAGGEGPIDADNRATGVGFASNYVGFGPDALSYIGSGQIAAGGSASMSRTIIPGPLPILEISASAAVTSEVSPDILPARGGTLGGYTAAGYTRLQYQFEWLGSPGLVNLDFQGMIKAEGSGSGGGATAHIALIDLNGDTRVYDQIGSFADGEHFDRSWIDAAGVNHVSHDANYGFTSFHENGVYAILANTTYIVDVSVSANASTSAGYEVFSDGASGNAFADPYLSIDPSTPNAGAYTLLISPGIGNSLAVAAPVPEPEIYAMILAGLGVIGFTSRRRRSH